MLQYLRLHRVPYVRAGIEINGTQVILAGVASQQTLSRTGYDYKNKCPQIKGCGNAWGVRLACTEEFSRVRFPDGPPFKVELATGWLTGPENRGEKSSVGSIPTVPAKL